MKDQKEIIKQVIDYIERNLEKEINLDNISKDIGYSKFHLNRVFTEQTGITIYKYLQNRRLTIAAEKLVKTDKPITQIAYEAGYDTQQSFSFAFKQVYLYPPKTYRNIGIFMPKQNRISMYYSCMPKYYKFISASNEPSSHACMDIWRLPRESNTPQLATRYLTAEIKEVAA